MFKKMFALASVTALMGVVSTMTAAGCSSTTDGGGTDDASTPVGEGGAKDGKAPIPPDEDAAVEPTTCPSNTPITAADVEAAIKWVPPSAIQAVCTQPNIDALKDLFDKATAGVKYADMKTALGATCSACAFSKDTAPNWQPIVEATNGFLNNSGPSCFAQLETAACGKAAFHFERCLATVCPAACTNDDCTDKASGPKGACNQLLLDANTACPNLTETLKVCKGLIDGIVVSCAGGPDGGIDAATNP